MISALSLAASSGIALTGDVAAGVIVFKKCGPCHDIGETAKNKVGPELNGMPLRLQNLAALEFDTHLFMREGPRAISTLELPAGQVKNRTELAFDIPPFVAKMLIEYRDRFAPKVIGHRPTRLFVNVDGTPKNQATVAGLIMTYLRRAGIVLTPHQFRHLSAKVVLDAEPGGFETVKQFLGHESIKTTVGAYAGIDSRRAARRLFWSSRPLQLKCQRGDQSCAIRQPGTIGNGARIQDLSAI